MQTDRQTDRHMDGKVLMNTEVTELSGKMGFISVR